VIEVNFESIKIIFIVSYCKILYYLSKKFWEGGGFSNFPLLFSYVVFYFLSPLFQKSYLRHCGCTGCTYTTEWLDIHFLLFYKCFITCSKIILSFRNLTLCFIVVVMFKIETQCINTNTNTLLFIIMCMYIWMYVYQWPVYNVHLLQNIWVLV